MMSKSSSSGNNIGKDDVVKLCPLCKAAVKFIFINFSEKVLMCVNEFCNFPFGYEDLQFIKVDTGIKLPVGASSSARRNKSGSSSETSYSTLSDIDELNKICGSMKNELLDFDVKQTNSKKKKIPNKHIANNKEIKKNVQDLKHLTMELNATDQLTDDRDFIKNEKWLRNLNKMQGLSGKKFIKKEEMNLLKQKTPAFDGGELKIDIDSNRYNSSPINIQIMNTDGDRTTLEDVT